MVPGKATLSEMDTVMHLIVEAGPLRGREVHIPAGGARIGRSSRNDVVLDDPSMSRFHCRVFFKPGEGLWVADLGSSNETLLNGAAVQESRVRPGDRISIGDTVLGVVNDREPGDAGSGATSVVVPPAEPAAPPSEGVIDLGLKKAMPQAGTNRMRRFLVGLAAAMATVAILAWVPWNRLVEALEAYNRPPAREVPVALPVLDVSYERVEATSSNIFRYFVEIRNETLVVQVDDLGNARHVRREKKVEVGLLRDLAKSIEATGFMDLLDDYSGLAPGVYESSDIGVTIGAKACRTRVFNRVEPDAFAAVRGQIEEFGKNELGLAALAVEPQKLIEKANEALLLGKKLYDEREVRYENLAGAIRAFRECEWYLETIEPKPAFYGDALSRRSDCERELQKRYDDIWFMAERSVKLRDWKEAARHLRIVCDMIPDRSDERNQNAYKKLVDVERHLGAEK